MTSKIEQWYSRKMSGRQWRICAPYLVTEEWRKSNCRRHFAKLTLSVTPANAFDFVSNLDFGEEYNDLQRDAY